MAAPEIEGDRAGEPHAFDPRQRVAENAAPSAATTLSDAGAGDISGKPDDGDDSPEPTSLEQTFERKYDHLGPVDFAKELIRFGDWLGREGKNLSPAEMAHALAEYSFLQDRLSFWLNYDDKQPTAQGNLLSAALTLYQGAVIGGFARPGHLPNRCSPLPALHRCSAAARRAALARRRPSKTRLSLQRGHPKSRDLAASVRRRSRSNYAARR